MPCIEFMVAAQPARSAARRAIAVLSIAVAACSGPSADRAPGELDSARVAAPTAPSPTVPAGRQARRELPAPRSGRNWADVRQQAAERLVAANPDITYVGAVPEPLLAIPVLEIELNGDGSVRRIEILREPREAKDTLKIAVEAVRRAAPFGDVSRLPRPWKFTETFLFDDARKFKPRTLDR